jgi:hypothetical protein
MTRLIREFKEYLIVIGVPALIVLLVGIAAAASTSEPGNKMLGKYSTYATLNSVTNSAAYDFSRTYGTFGCDFTRTGTGTIVVTLQGSRYIDSLFTNKTSNHTITNAPDTKSISVSPDSGHRLKRLRVHVVSGVNVTNTLTPVCGVGGN